MLILISRLLRRRRRDLLRDQDGSAAIEFAMVGVPFIAMMFSILELGMVFVLDSLVQTAAVDSGRLIRTGQVDAKKIGQDAFKTQFCARMSIFKTECADRATIDVRVLPQFASIPPDPVTNGRYDPDKAKSWQPGQPGNIVVVRVFYRQPTLITYLAQGTAGWRRGSSVLVATTAFRNEPWY